MLCIGLALALAASLAIDLVLTESAAEPRSLRWLRTWWERRFPPADRWDRSPRGFEVKPVRQDEET